MTRLCDAAQAGFLTLPAALDLLPKTNFRASPELWMALYTPWTGDSPPLPVAADGHPLLPHSLGILTHIPLTPGPGCASFVGKR